MRRKEKALYHPSYSGRKKEEKKQPHGYWGTPVRQFVCIPNSSTSRACQRNNNKKVYSHDLLEKSWVLSFSFLWRDTKALAIVVEYPKLCTKAHSPRIIGALPSTSRCQVASLL